nr:immunoglobulin light chain junction region [Macaca mulatta]
DYFCSAWDGSLTTWVF